MDLDVPKLVELFSTWCCSDVVWLSIMLVVTDSIQILVQFVMVFLVAVFSNISIEHLCTGCGRSSIDPIILPDQGRSRETKSYILIHIAVRNGSTISTLFHTGILTARWIHTRATSKYRIFGLHVVAKTVEVLEFGTDYAIFQLVAWLGYWKWLVTYV